MRHNEIRGSSRRILHDNNREIWLIMTRYGDDYSFLLTILSFYSLSPLSSVQPTPGITELQLKINGIVWT